MTIKEFLVLSSVATNPNEIRDQIVNLPKPEFIGKKKVPSTLDGITMGQLIELQSIRTIEECLFTPGGVLLFLPPQKIKEYPAEEMLALFSWASKEVERINKLLSSTNLKPTAEEQCAGIEQLSFGVFGLIDYYAIRMGITDHEQVEQVPWVRVYKCLDMDAKKIQYERKLREIYQNKKI